jgi:hypothetical protein
MSALEDRRRSIEWQLWAQTGRNRNSRSGVRNGNKQTFVHQRLPSTYSRRRSPLVGLCRLLMPLPERHVPRTGRFRMSGFG